MKQFSHQSEQGYFFVEAILITVLLMGMVSGIALYQKVAEMKNVSSARWSALFLAQAEMSYIEGQTAKTKTAPGGTIAWLGDDEALIQNNCQYNVKAQAEPIGNEGSQVIVTVEYQCAGRKQSVNLERQVYVHEKQAK